MTTRSQARKRQLYGKDSRGYSNPPVTPATMPLNTVAPAVTGTPTVGQTLTCTNGTWTGTPAPTFTKQWRAAGVDIAGANANTFVLTAAQAGKNVNCSVFGTNVAGTVVAQSNAVAVP